MKREEAVRRLAQLWAYADGQAISQQHIDAADEWFRCAGAVFPDPALVEVAREAEAGSWQKSAWAAIGEHVMQQLGPKP